jgi:hypothetical protein
VELVPDDRGKILAALTDRYLTTALFHSVNAAVKVIAIWDYIVRLLQLLDDVSDKVKRNIVKQELSNTFHFEYRRAQDAFKRQVAVHIARKCFRRYTDAISGRSKIIMKGQPAECTVSNPQLHYILRLCHSDTSPSDAVSWIQKLDEHNGRYADDRAKLNETEMAALDELIMIVSFMHMISTAINMAPVSRKSGLQFTARMTDLDLILNSIKSRADFGNYVVPMNNLLEPQMATSALTALDDFVLREAGVRLGSLYEEVLTDSLSELDYMYADEKARLGQADVTTYVPLPKDSPAKDAQVSPSRAKEKTRSANPSAYTITSPSEAEQSIAAEPTQLFKVKDTTASLFAALFSRSEARGSVAWTDFESAMADLKFSVTPRGGSRIAFNPPPSVEGGPATIHRPHESDIEGRQLLYVARTLHMVYGWKAHSFVAA